MGGLGGLFLKECLDLWVKAHHHEDQDGGIH